LILVLQGRAPCFVKPAPCQAFLTGTALTRPGITTAQLAAILLGEHGLKVAPPGISRVLRAPGFTYKLCWHSNSERASNRTEAGQVSGYGAGPGEPAKQGSNSGLDLMFWAI
jgi:transposase